MEELAGEVEKNEPGCLGYQYFYNEATEEVVVLEMYVVCKNYGSTNETD